MTPHPLRFLTSILLAVLMLSACTPASVTPGADGTASAVPDRTSTPLPPIAVDPASLDGLNIQVWHAFAGEVNPIFTQQVAQFNSYNEWGITVTESGYGDYPTLLDAVNAAIEAGETPVLVATLPEQTLAWDASGQVVDLNPYIADPQWGLGNGVAADFPELYWAQDNVNGRQLGLPAQRSTRVLYYNTTWAHELGFSNPPASADEFRQQACAANAAFKSDSSLQNDGYGGWIVDTDWQTSYSWLLGFGGSVQDGDTYRFRTDENLAALEFLKSLYDDNCAWISTEAAPFDSFARRAALFVSSYLADAWLVENAMKQAGSTDDWTALPFPGTDGSVLVVYGPSYSLLTSTPERQLAAWLFARWMISPENQAQWVEAAGLLPLRTSVVEMVSQYRAASPQWAAVVDDLSLGRTVPQLASWRKMRYVLEDGMAVIFHANMPVDLLSSILTEMDLTAEDPGIK
jgi:multiple sugar transport system substrate-binding protein